MARAMTHAILSVHKFEICSNKILFSSILCKWNTQCISISRFPTRGFAKWERSWGGRTENTRIGSRFMKLTRIFVAFSRYLWLNQTTVTSFLFLLRGNEKMCVCGSSSSSSNITRYWSPSVQQYHMSGENKLSFIAVNDNAFSFFFCKWCTNVCVGHACKELMKMARPHQWQFGWCDEVNFPKSLKCNRTPFACMLHSVTGDCARPHTCVVCFVCGDESQYDFVLNGQFGENRFSLHKT